jgi:Ubiquitin fusion degradation protein UFD1
MPTTIYPLLYHETLAESELEKCECSNGIYVSATRFSGLNHGAVESEIVILKLTHGGRSVLAHITGIHHGESSVVYAPSWMFYHLSCDEAGDPIVIERVHPALGTKIRIQPYTSEYTRENDPVAALRNAFENYSCLEVGQNVPLLIASQRLHVDILGTNSDGPICIRGLEIEVEIDRPHDYVEPEPVPEPVRENTWEPMVVPAFVDTRFPGTGYRLGS